MKDESRSGKARKEHHEGETHGPEGGGESPDSLDPRLATALDQVARLQELVHREKKKRKKAEALGEQKTGNRLGSNRGIETMFRTTYNTHIDLSGLADNKANIMISINGIIISILLASIAPRLADEPLLLLPTAILLVGCLISMVYAVLAARPRVTSRQVSLEDVRDGRANILFFGNFVSLSEEDFVEGMRDLMIDTEEAYMNMVRDIHSLGRVLSRKFSLLRVSYNAFMGGLVAGVVLFLIVFAVDVLAGRAPVLMVP